MDTSVNIPQEQMMESKRAVRFVDDTIRLSKHEFFNYWMREIENVETYELRQIVEKLNACFPETEETKQKQSKYPDHVIDVLNVRINQLRTSQFGKEQLTESDIAKLAHVLGIEYHYDFSACWRNGQSEANRDVIERVGDPEKLIPGGNPLQQAHNLLEILKVHPLRRKDPGKYDLLSKQAKEELLYELQSAFKHSFPDVAYSSEEKQQILSSLSMLASQLTIMEDKNLPSGENREELKTLQGSRQEMIASFVEFVGQAFPDFQTLTEEEKIRRWRLSEQIGGYEFRSLIFDSSTDKAYAAYHSWRRTNGYGDAYDTQGPLKKEQFAKWKMTPEAEPLRQEEEYQELYRKFGSLARIFVNFREKENPELTGIRQEEPDLFAHIFSSSAERFQDVIEAYRRHFPELSKQHETDEAFIFACMKSEQIQGSIVQTKMGQIRIGQLHEPYPLLTTPILFVTRNYSPNFMGGYFPADAEVSDGPLGHEQAFSHYMNRLHTYQSGDSEGLGSDMLFPFPTQMATPMHIEVPYENEKGDVRYIALVLLDERQESAIDPELLFSLKECMSERYAHEDGNKHDERITHVQFYSLRRGQMTPIHSLDRNRAQMLLQNKRRKVGNHLMMSG